MVARSEAEPEAVRSVAEPALNDQAVPPVLAHEVAELEAIRQRQVNGLDLRASDMLLAGHEPTGRTLSLHDQGRPVV
jgi:hypothetical protein